MFNKKDNTLEGDQIWSLLKLQTSHRRLQTSHRQLQTSHRPVINNYRRVTDDYRRVTEVYFQPLLINLIAGLLTFVTMQYDLYMKLRNSKTIDKKFRFQKLYFHL